MIIFLILIPCYFSLNAFNYLNSSYLSFCNRHISNEGQIGCSSKPGGSYGILRFILNASDVETFKREPLLDKHVIVINYDIFSDVPTMNYLKSHHHVAGVVVTQNEDRPEKFYFSENSNCPNPSSSIYSSQCSDDYIANATSRIFYDFPFPVVHLRGDNRKYFSQLMKCYHEFNTNPQDDTRCSVEISNFMMGVGDSETCIRRSIAVNRNILIDDSNLYCQEIGMSSSYIHAKSDYHWQPRKPKSTLLVLTRIDARSMFEMSGFGQKGVSVSASILLSVVKNFFDNALIKNGTDKLPYDMTFGFVDSEEFDYLGSLNLLNHIESNSLAKNTKAPITIASISSIIEIGLISNPEDGKKYFMMTDGETLRHQTKEIEKLRKDLSQVATGNGLVFQASPKEILPSLSSIQTILKHDRNVDHILVTDSDALFKDPVFDSIFDDSINDLRANGTHLEKLANTLLSFIMKRVTDNPGYEPLKIISNTPLDFLECFQNDMLMPELELVKFKQLMQPISMQDYTKNLPEVNFVGAQLLSRMLIYLTGKEYPITDGNCPILTNTGPFYYHSISTNKGTVCYQTNVEIHSQSHSSVVNPRWLRSNVKTKFVRYYRSASILIEILTFIIGLIFTISIAVAMIVFRLYIKIDFPQDELSEQEVSVPSTSQTTYQ